MPEFQEIQLGGPHIKLYMKHETLLVGDPQAHRCN